MIIDFHTHIFPPQVIKQREKYAALDPVFSELYSNPKARLITADELIACMDEQNVDISVALNIAWSHPDICQETNDYIIESVNRFPGRLIGFGMVRLDLADRSITEIERIAKLGIKGIGEIRPRPDIIVNIDLIRLVIQEIIDQNLVLLTHSSEPVGHTYAGKGNITPDVLYSFINGFPQLKLVCAHWGGGLPFYALMPEVKKALSNVYFDSAASPYLYAPRVYEKTAELVGTDKVLFGTDYPLLTPKRLLSQIDTLKLDENLKQRLLSDNALELLRLSNTG